MREFEEETVIQCGLACAIAKRERRVDVSRAQGRPAVAIVLSSAVRALVRARKEWQLKRGT